MLNMSIYNADGILLVGLAFRSELWLGIPWGVCICSSINFMEYGVSQNLQDSLARSRSDSLYHRSLAFIINR